MTDLSNLVVTAVRAVEVRNVPFSVGLGICWDRAWLRAIGLD
jgi:hypothetical protein